VRKQGNCSPTSPTSPAGRPVCDVGGTVAGVLLYAADVTAHARDQKRLEALAGDLAASEERYRTLFETMPQGIVHYGADQSILGANQAACEILGMDLAAATSWPVVPEGQAVREDGSPFPPEDLPVRVALRTGEIVADTVAGVRHGRTGELRWVRITAVPDARDEQGRPSRAYAIFTDLTEQRRTEAALRQSTALLGRLREANVLGVVVVGEHQVYEANDAYLDIIGYSRDDLEAGRIAWRKITPPEWAGAEDKAVGQLRQAGACQPFEKEYVHKDGHRVPVLLAAAASSRNPLRWTSFVIDLTARQRAERERAALLARARANRAEADSARERSHRRPIARACRPAHAS
jgi:PAS domain S-box-containing protein